jgi:hypothetical protein
MLNLFAPLRFLLTRCNENKLLRQFEVLKAENAMLRKRASKNVTTSCTVRPCGAALRSAAAAVVQLRSRRTRSTASFTRAWRHSEGYFRANSSAEAV